MKSTDYYEGAWIYIFRFLDLFSTIIAAQRLLTYLFAGYQSQSTVLGAKSLLRPSFSPFSRRGAIPVRVNEGNHHEILWNSEVF